MRTRFVTTLPALVLAVLAIVLAIVGLMRYEQKPVEAAVVEKNDVTSEPEPAAVFTYVFAVENIEAGQKLVPELFQSVETAAELDGALLKEDVPFGETLKVPVNAGMPLTRSALEDVSDLARVLSVEERAMAFDLNPLSGIGGLLVPGDRVDVIATFRSDSKDMASSSVILSDLEVLAIRGLLDPRAEPEDDDRNKRNATMVLAVPREDVGRLALASAESHLRFVASSREIVVDALSEPNDQAATASPEEMRKANVAFLSEIRPRSPEAIAKEEAKKQQEEKKKKEDPGHKVHVFEGSGTRTVYVR
ncbi:Flp pilus assembly protein CpaB [Marinobacter daepoensis]|uniref:Flp pilus assembly protein CpaB n=1 Tax=Marinobacter daepoensis TaxID=262077 RepID=UPI0003FF5ABA|nr:Flp pilus assembly protein CpaB [Marinobacter daepoensis]MBY6033594.1 Flp pilus assembly protein CpaB [Marinobacter daepoensis]